MAALWATTMMIFAYVDLFSLFRPDFRAALDQGKVFVFDVGQPFLLGVTIYVIIPSLMIYLSLVMPRRLNRVVSISLAGLYAITIVGGAVGEWSYYVLGSVVEVVLLTLVIHHSWTWRAPKTD
jgi:MFS family permease